MSNSKIAERTSTGSSFIPCNKAAGSVISKKYVHNSHFRD